MHPAFNALAPGMDFDPPSSLLGGEALLAKIYNAIRSSTSDRGSNVFNTLLMVNFDEHGGTYDHVAPPAAPPPDPAAPAGQMDFTFNRSGIRVPAIAISPWVAERTIVNDEYRHTSVIRTLRERWSLGAPLTARDAVAPDIAPILSREEPRNPSDWPDVVPLPVPKFDATLVPLDFPLGPLPRAIFSACLGLGKALGQSVPDIAQDADVKGYDALTMVRDMFFNVFPGLQSHS
jgi:phospholipase C